VLSLFPSRFSRRGHTLRNRSRFLTLTILHFLLFSLLLLNEVRGTGLSWPTNRFLPAFSTPATTIDCIDITSVTAAEVDLFASLQGIVNRAQPRIACVYNSAEEGKFTWLAIHSVPYALINGYSAITKYKTNLVGLVVTDPGQPDTLNLATTIAGLNNELICDPTLLGVLTNAPYSLPVKDDLRGKFSNKFEAYQFLYTNYWPQCTHRIIAGMETNGHGHLREYLVATETATLWLNPGVPSEAAALAPFLSDMTPVGGVYMGWWPDEGAGLGWIAAYGIPVIASDWFDNASLFSGITNPVIIPPIPSPPTLQNKVYISITLSDGDNVQYMQHHMKNNWGNAARGRVPMGWTAQPLAADIDPGMLNYYWGTATSNDCLVAGPSGAGYTRLNFWGPANAAAYTIASEPYLQRSGMRSITVWSSLSSGTAHYYAANCPTLLGINDFGNGSYATNFGALPTIGFPANANYASAATNLINGITNAAAAWNGSSPMFIAVEGSGWNITPADCQTVANALNTNQYIIVRPDHLFMLYRQAAGLSNSGPPRIIEDLQSTMRLPAGFPLSLTVYPVGAPPLSYQWQFNNINLSNSDRVTGAQSANLTVTPAFVGDAGLYRVIVSNALGLAASVATSVSIGRDALNSAAGWSRNGHAGPLTNNSVMLTDGNPSEASSVFLNCPQFIEAFVASFTYQDVGGGGADGCVFILHKDSAGPWAIGAPGSSLGCSGISPAVALQFNIYSPNGVGMALRTDGQTGGPYTSTSPVNLAGGNPIGVSLVYTGSVFSITLTDMVTHVKFVTNALLNIPAVLGTNTAYVGFTAADGGVSSRQVVSNFQFASLMSIAAHQGDSNTVILNWPNSAGGLVLQQTPSFGSAWSIVTDNVSLDPNHNNQVTIPSQAATIYYRLATP
jgi:hypothetical protein